MTLRLLPAALALCGALPFAAAAQTPPTGPAVGSVVPAFETVDQDGRPQSLKTLAGPNGTLLVFFRSADW